MGPPGAPSLANHKRPRATTVLTHNLREQVLRRAGLVAAATIIIGTCSTNARIDTWIDYTEQQRRLDAAEHRPD